VHVLAPEGADGRKFNLESVIAKNGAPDWVKGKADSGRSAMTN